MLGHKENAANYWDRFSHTYDKKLENAFGKDLRRNLARVLDGEHDLGNAVEFGCGTGYFTRVIAKNAKHVTATDISPNMLAVARSNLKDLGNISFQAENSEATSLPSETFDTALMANMLHTLDDPLKALKECYRVLKKGGTLLIINYTDEGMGRVERTLLLFRFALKFGFPPKKNWPMTGDKLRSQLGSAGFRIKKMDLIKGKINAFYIKAKKA